MGIEAEVVQAKTWLQKHERLLIVFAVLLVGAWGFQKYANIIANRDNIKAATLQQKLEDEKAANANLASQAALTASQYQTMVQADKALIASLAASVAARNSDLTKQTAVDTTATMAELLSRWEFIVPNTHFDGAPVTADGGVAVSVDNARATVIQLEKVPVLQADLKDETTLAETTKTELGKANDLTTVLTKQVNGLNLQLSDSDKTCKAEIASVKADDRKGKIRFFKIGFITGFVAGLWTGRTLP